MDLVNELSSELALTFLVEKKHAERLNANDVLALIGKIKEVLVPLSADKSLNTIILPSAVSAKSISH